MKGSAFVNTAHCPLLVPCRKSTIETSPDSLPRTATQSDNDDEDETSFMSDPVESTVV